MILKAFQAEAVADISENICKLLSRQENHPEDTVPIQVILKSPTGSGKTIMAGEILKNLSDYFENHDYAIIWAAPNKLHAQSHAKLSRLLANSPYRLVDVEGLSAGPLSKNTVLFTNWEKLFKKDRSGEWANVAVRQGEDGRNLQDIMEATRATGTGVILIVDESHQTFYGPNSQALVQGVICPNLVFEISATPKAIAAGDSNHYYRRDVEITDVIDSELIKNEVHVNKDIAESITDAKTAIEAVLEAALKKRDELAELYCDNSIDINPLLLIQLPNSKESLSELDLQDKEIIEDYLVRNGYGYAKGNLAIWLADDKKNLEHIEENRNTVNVLIFKQAIALGWDCPRAQILVMLRDIKSETFSIQTVGRILRMPEAKHYVVDALNKAYVYTDLSTLTVDPNDADGPNLIKFQVAKRRRECEQIALPDSVFIHRTDYGDLRADFKPILDNILNQAFSVEEKEIIGEKRYDRIAQNLKVESGQLTTPIISDVIINNLDEYQADEYETCRVAMDMPSIERVFNIILRSYMGQFKNFARSKSIVGGTLYHWFGLANIDVETVQRIIACSEENQRIFGDIFAKALDVYDTVNRDEMLARRQREVDHFVFSIPEQDEFNEDYLPTIIDNCVMTPFYRKKKPFGTETSFEKMLAESEQIDWWYKNGEKQNRYFAVPYYYLDENQKTRRRAFYPDYIIKYRDGSIGIYDTKAGFTASNDEVRQKANALQEYIAAHDGLNLKGGIVKVENGRFYLQDCPDYDEDVSNETGRWKLFNI